MEDNQPIKSLGQHWLKDPKILQEIAKEAEISADDTVLEIGPGLGTLTEVLVKRAKRVIAVEFDKILATRLPERVKARNLEVINQNILEFDLTKLDPDYKVVANIPYYITGHLLRQFTETDNPPNVAVLLVQKEVAERINAVPGDMNLVSVSLQLHYDTSLGVIVTADKFTPPPKVDSQVVILKHRPNPLFADVDMKKFFQIVKAGFGGKRKKLRSSLAGGLQLSKEQTDSVLAKAGVDGNLRAQNLSLDDWHKLYLVF